MIRTITKQIIIMIVIEENTDLTGEMDRSPLAFCESSPRENRWQLLALLKCWKMKTDRMLAVLALGFPGSK